MFTVHTTAGTTIEATNVEFKDGAVHITGSALGESVIIPNHMVESVRRKANAMHTYTITFKGGMEVFASKVEHVGNEVVYTSVSGDSETVSKDDVVSIA